MIIDYIYLEQTRSICKYTQNFVSIQKFHIPQLTSHLNKMDFPTDCNVLTFNNGSLDMNTHLSGFVLTIHLL